jgi:predicted Zn-dependent protease
MPKTSRTLVVLALTWTLSGAATLAVSLISVQQEIEIGREANAQLKQKTPEITDPNVVSYVRGIGRKLAAHAGGPRYPYSYSIANYREINAFALPGGPVWIHRGAFEAAQTESQLAGVLAHETAHIARRHAADQLTKAMVANGLLTLLGALLGNGTGARSAEVAARFLAGGYMLKFSRDDERDADRVGAQIMRRAGWDNRGMLEFMQVLREKQGHDPSAVEVFLSTHPAPAGRVAELRSVVRAGGRRDSKTFHEMRQRLGRSGPAHPMPKA